MSTNHSDKRVAKIGFSFAVGTSGWTQLADLVTVVLKNSYNVKNVSIIILDQNGASRTIWNIFPKYISTYPALMLTQFTCAHTCTHVYTHIHVHTVTEAKSHGCHSLPQRCFTKGLRRPVLRRGTPFPGDPELDGDLHRPSLTTLLNSFFFFFKKECLETKEVKLLKILHV